jgi:hypothetical protein
LVLIFKREGFFLKNRRKSEIAGGITMRPASLIDRYAVKCHAARHARAEGFTETDMVHVLENGRELAVYPEDSRMLVLGYITFSPQLRIPLHVVVDYSGYRWLDIVTAYIPDQPYRVVSRERVAILVSEDRERTIRPREPRSRPRGLRFKGFAMR